MRAFYAVLLAVGSASLLAPVGCSSTERNTLGSPGKNEEPVGNGATTKPADPPGTNPDFVNNPQPDAGEEMAEVCSPDPGRFDAPGNNCDDDNDGTVDNPLAACDAALQVTGGADEFAKALGLCRTIESASARSGGLISAKYMKGFNQSAQPAAGQTASSKISARS